MSILLKYKEDIYENFNFYFRNDGRRYINTIPTLLLNTCKRIR